MRDEMQVGDLMLFYHSRTKPAGVAGIGKICKKAYPDYTAWDLQSPYYDPKSSPDNARWVMVDVKFVNKFPRFVSREEMKMQAGLEDIWVLRRGMRLSIQPVEERHFRLIKRLGRWSP